MKSPRLYVHDVKFCAATYDTTGLLPFMPYQTLNCLPPMVTVPFGMVAPIGWLFDGSWYQTIR